MRSHYAVLKVAFDAPDAVIRAAWRALAARHHPDRCDGDPAATRRMQQVNEAYRVLSDPLLRAAHTAALQRARQRRASDAADVAASPGDATYPPRPLDAVGGATDAWRRRRAAAAYAAHAAPGG